MSRLRLVVAGGSQQSLQTVVSLLEMEFEIVATAADGPSAINRVRHTKPDVFVLDHDALPEGAIEVARQLAEHQQAPPVVICSADTGSESVEAALGAGVMAYVFKARIEEDLVVAVQSAHQGRSFISGKSHEPDYARFFTELGRRVRALREKAGYRQADMESFGFSTRHWQQIEAGRPTTMTTLLRICEAFKIRLEDLLRGLDQDIYHHR